MEALSTEPVVRAADVQAILRLVGGAAELWYTPALQRQFTLDSLCGLLKARVGICYTWGDCLVGGTTPCSDMMHVGLDAAGGAAFEQFAVSGTPADPVMEVLAALPGRVVTMIRHEAVADADWKKSEHFQKLRRPLDLGSTLYVKINAQLIERTTIVTLCRTTKATAFTERDAYLVNLCLSEMAWPFTADMSFTDPKVEALQPRLKKVMKHLLEGDSEKQVALKLKLSPHTVHEYVKNLYADLGVCSRGELLAQFVGKV